jgi:aspartyl-tRNA(Asn)/glutamyl-tRNA(Gln) amidotransferase subunit A
LAIHDLTAHEIREKILRREFSAVEAARDCLARIKEVDGRIKAFLLVDEEGALAAARGVDEKIARGEKVGKLAGVPVAVKDVLCTKGVRTTCASKILANYVPPYDAHVVERLKAEDAVILGKTNMDEFAMGSSTENSGFFTTRNPWDLDRAPGGSSGGSSAAVAAHMAPLALGSDTGGSIRQPAALCNVDGLKPTYGRVSRYGLVAFASSLDQIGPFARDIMDTALLSEVISGYDRRDSTSVALPVPEYTKETEGGAAGVKIGVPREYFGEGIDPEVEAAVREALKLYERLGAKVAEISLPHTQYAVAVYYIVATAEASSNLARYDGVHYGHRTKKAEDIIQLYSATRAEGFGPEVKRRIMLGTYALSSGYYDAYYLKASKVRALIRRDFEEAFKTVDCVVCPTSPTPAFKLGEKTADPLQMYLSDIYTISANLASIPGISIPCGFTKAGLPIGMQILGKHFDEATLLRVARAFERETDYHTRRPLV